MVWNPFFCPLSRTLPSWQLLASMELLPSVRLLVAVRDGPFWMELRYRTMEPFGLRGSPADGETIVTIHNNNAGLAAGRFLDSPATATDLQAYYSCCFPDITSCTEYTEQAPTPAPTKGKSRRLA